MIFASTVSPILSLEVSSVKLDSINCFIPRDILSLSESIDKTIDSSDSPFLYDLMKSSGLPMFVTSEI